MTAARHLFPGGNTAIGFVNHFEDILPVSEARRIYRIKGGPGVGKSSLMHALGREMEQKGEPVIYFHCSSDPNSLDGVLFPRIQTAFMDGTAPHVMDPVLPGAMDGIINLGDCLDDAQLVLHRQEIEPLGKRIALLFDRAYGYLSAAGSVLDSAERQCPVLPTVIEDAAAKLTGQYLPQLDDKGRQRHLFLSAYTPKGLISFSDMLPVRQAIYLAAPFGLSASPLLEKLATEALTRGYESECYHHPLLPSHISHLYLPEQQLFFTTDQYHEPVETIDLSAGHTAEALWKTRSFDQHAHALLTQRASECLQEAKALHDELEQFYVAAMDFSHWEQMRIKIMAGLNASLAENGL